MKVLLLEDNETFLNLIQEILYDSGYSVSCFTDGLNALEHCCDGYDCFILDINVPTIDGINLLREIRGRDKKTPVIIISANSDLESIKKAYSKGCNEYLKKPFYMYELETKIKNLCNINDAIVLADGYVFDNAKELLFDKSGMCVKLTKYEKRFFNILLKYHNKMTPLEVIENYVWEGKVGTPYRIRSLVKRL